MNSDRSSAASRPPASPATHGFGPAWTWRAHVGFLRQLRGVFLGVLLAAIFLGCGSGDPEVGPIRVDELAPIPHPDLSAAEETARLQIEDQRTKLESFLAEATGSDDEDSGDLAEEMGRMANLYHAYGLTGPALVAYENASALDPNRFEWRYGAGMARLQAGDLEAAVRDFEAAIDHPFIPLFERGIARLRLAETLVALDRLEEAREAFDRASSVVELEAAIESGLGRIALRENRADDAIGHFERALDLEPGAGALHHRLSLAYRKQGDSEAATRHLEAVTPGDVVVEDPIGDAISELAMTTGALARRGARDLVNDRPEDAVETYRAAVESDPDNVDARRSLAIALLDMGDAAAAVSELEAAVELEPNNAQLHFDLGNARQTQGKTKAAIDALTRAIEITPDYASALFNRANAHMRENRWTDALSDLQRLLELDPTHSRARYQRAMAMANTGRASEGITLLRELLKDEPDNREAQRGLNDLLKQPAPAEPTEGGTDRESLLRRALKLAESGDHPSALETLEQALEEFPDDALFTSVLTRLLASSPDDSVRDGPRALALAQRLYESRPGPDNTETLAMALAETGEFELAERVMEALIQQVELQGDASHLPRLRAALERYRRRQPQRME